ncbi:hypothetical protein QBC46DRAFT_399218 [Diplogelasinospora grovesii]|uniref:UPF0261 domain-containing protein n=1 Tax=Diplogelasinospora grovesii TaxID=303347 RepID=A0AAN6RZN6_9PEZI|nr:hypothetical protein QBC46DRAFT_399218 [Diplogelasinospora grovesii]
MHRCRPPACFACFDHTTLYRQYTKMATVALLGTCDTKLFELLFLREKVLETRGVQVIMIHVGRRDVDHPAINIFQDELVARHGTGKTPYELPRDSDELIEFMSDCAAQEIKELYEDKAIDGIVSAAGPWGTQLVARIMRQALPIGFPKIIVSSVASGDTGAIVGETDIAVMCSVVDVVGFNQVLNDVLSNAGASIGAAALAYAYRRTLPPSSQLPLWR